MPVKNVGRVVNEVPATAQIVRVVVEVPAALLDELLVVGQTHSSALLREVLKTFQHLGALISVCAIGAPEDPRG
jgi:hypothetical protein